MPFYTNRLEAIIHEPISELWKEFKLWSKMSKQDWGLFSGWDSAGWRSDEIFGICCGRLVPYRHVTLRNNCTQCLPYKVVKLLKIPLEDMVKYLGDKDPLMDSVCRYRFNLGV